jgi:hypothetical protein
LTRRGEFLLGFFLAFQRVTGELGVSGDHDVAPFRRRNLQALWVDGALRNPDAEPRETPGFT